MNLAGKQREVSDASRRATNVSLTEDLVKKAKAMGINISRACEDGLRAKLQEEQRANWKKETRGAAAAWNEYVEENGLPLAKYRMF